MREIKQINVDVGKRVRLFREANGYTREKFAEITGVSSRFIFQAESGQTGLSLTTLKKFCEALSVSSDKMLWGLDDSHFESMINLLSRLNEKDSRHVQIVENILREYLSGLDLTT